MGKLLVLLTFLGNYPGVPQSYQDASDTTRRALMADKSIQDDISKTTDRVERWSRNTLGLSKEDLVWFAYGSPIVTQKLSTKPFKNLKMSLGDGFVVHPEIEYSFKPDDPETFRCFLILTREF